MHVRLVLVLWISHFSASSASSGMRTIKGSRGTFCGGAFYASYDGVSALGCARKCSSDNSCVAYSLQPDAQSCLLHDTLCAATDLVPAPAALYAEVTTACMGGACYDLSVVGREVAGKAEAQAACEAMGAHLLAIETPQENDLINQLLAQPRYQAIEYIWLDLIDHETWQHSGQQATFTNWDYQYPKLGQQCTIRQMQTDGTWHTVLCTKEWSYVCETNNG